MKFTNLGHSLARRGAWVLAIVALLVVLALSACGRGGTTQTIQEATATPTLPPVEQVVQTDSSFDAVLAALDSASVDASIDESAKDNIAVP
jgi:hypothetical protein